MCDVDETTSLFFSSRNLPRYGTTSELFVRPDYKMIKHKVTPADTLQGLSLKYGVSVMEIKRINKIWSNDNIHTIDTLNIPVPSSSSFEIENSFSHSDKAYSTPKSDSFVSASDLLKRVDASLKSGISDSGKSVNGSAKVQAHETGAAQIR